MTKVYKMVAVTGDLGPNGMSDSAKTITLNSKQVKLARAYIEQTKAYNKAINTLLPVMFNHDLSEKLRMIAAQEVSQLNDIDQDAYDKMLTAGLFTSKYDARTTWKIVAE